MGRLIKLAIAFFSIFYVVNIYACDFLAVNGGDDWHPYFSREGDGKHGVVGDAIFLAGQRAGIKIVLQPSNPWKRVLFRLRHGGLDVIAGALKTKQREQQFNFSPEIYHADLNVFVRRDYQFNFAQISDLKGLHGGKVRGMSLGQTLDDYAFTHLVIDDVPDPRSLLKMVKTGRLDYGVFYGKAGNRELALRGLDKEVVQLENSVSREGIFIAYSKNSECQPKIKRLNEEIAFMLDDGSMKKIITKYLNKEQGLKKVDHDDF